MEQMGTWEAKVNLNGKQWEQGRQRGIRGTIMGTRGKDGTNGNKSEFKWETMGTRETKGTRETWEQGIQREQGWSQWGNGQLMGMGKAELQACLRKLYSFMFDRNT